MYYIILDYTRINNIPVLYETVWGKSRMSVTFSKVVVPQGQIITINTTSLFVCSFFFLSDFFHYPVFLLLPPLSRALIVTNTYIIRVRSKENIYFRTFNPEMHQQLTLIPDTHHSREYTIAFIENTVIDTATAQCCEKPLRVNPPPRWVVFIFIHSQMYMDEGKGSRARKVFDVKKISSPAVR